MAYDLKKIRDEILAFDEDLDSAQAHAASEAKRARIGAIGTDLASTFGGYKADKSHWDNVAAQGRQGVQDAVQRHGAQVKGYETARDLELDDPESETSAMARQYMSRLAPNIDFSKHSFRNMQQISPWVERELEGQRAEAKARKEAEKAAQERANKLSDTADQREYERERDARQNAAALERARVLAAQKAAADANKQPNVPAGEASQIGQLDAAEKMVDSLWADWEKKAATPGSGLVKYIPGTDAAAYNDNKLAAAQGIGTILEGGKLTDADLQKYMKLVPEQGDSLERAQAKREQLKRLISEAKRSKVQGLSQAGYKTQGFTQTPVPPGMTLEDEVPLAGLTDEIAVIGPNGEDGTMSAAEFEQFAGQGWKRK